MFTPRKEPVKDAVKEAAKDEVKEAVKEEVKEEVKAAAEPTEGEVVAIAERDRMLAVVDIAYAKAAVEERSIRAKQAFYQSLKDQIWNDIVAP